MESAPIGSQENPIDLTHIDDAEAMMEPIHWTRLFNTIEAQEVDEGYETDVMWLDEEE